MLMSATRRFVVLCGLSLLAGASSISCTDALLSGYKNEQLRTEYRYALGEQYVEVDGMKLCYQDQGEGPPIVILPGLCTSIDYWQCTIPVLAEHHRVLAVDLPGLAKSDKPDASYDLEWITDRLAAFLDARRVTRAHFIGGSMGGHLVMLMALKYPSRVDKLVLMGTSGVWPKPGFLLDFGLKHLWNETIVIDHMRRNWPSIFVQIVRHQTPAAVRILAYQMSVRAVGTDFETEGRASARALRSIFYHSLRDRLGELRNPTLLIFGQHDPIHLPSDGRYMVAHMPNARLVVVPDAAHEVMLDQPEVFNSLVTAFLAGPAEPGVGLTSPPPATSRPSDGQLPPTAN